MNKEIILIDNGVYYQKENIYIFNDLTYLNSKFDYKAHKPLFEFDSLQEAVNLTDSMSNFCFPTLNDFKYNYEESMEKYNKVYYWKQICNFLYNYERYNGDVELTDLINHFAEEHKQRLQKEEEKSKPKRKGLFKWFKKDKGE